MQQAKSSTNTKPVVPGPTYKVMTLNLVDRVMCIYEFGGRHHTPVDEWNDDRPFDSLEAMFARANREKTQYRDTIAHIVTTSDDLPADFRRRYAGSRFHLLGHSEFSKEKIGDLLRSIPGHRYTVRIFWSPNDEGFIAEALELPGCSSWGATHQEALTELSDAIEAWLMGARAAGNPIPEPGA